MDREVRRVICNKDLKVVNSTGPVVLNTISLDLRLKEKRNPYIPIRDTVLCRLIQTQNAARV